MEGATAQILELYKHGSNSDKTANPVVRKLRLVHTAEPESIDNRVKKPNFVSEVKRKVLKYSGTYTHPVVTQESLPAVYKPIQFSSDPDKVLELVSMVDRPDYLTAEELPIFYQGVFDAAEKSPEGRKDFLRAISIRDAGLWAVETKFREHPFIQDMRFYRGPIEVKSKNDKLQVPKKPEIPVLRTYYALTCR